MTAAKPVTMTHPDSKQTIDVAPDMAPMYEAQGWETKTPPKK